MLSNIFCLSLLAILLHKSAATPTPSQKSWKDFRPTDIPVWKCEGADDLQCGDSCSSWCWQFTKTSLTISGSSDPAKYAGFQVGVKLGDDEVVPEGDAHCFTCGDLVMPGKDNGWELTLKTAGAPMTGPLPVYIKFPWETALFSADTNGPFMSDQVIGDDKIDCGSMSCGGGNNPMNCQTCDILGEFAVYHATPIEDCSYWED